MGQLESTDILPERKGNDSSLEGTGSENLFHLVTTFCLSRSGMGDPAHDLSCLSPLLFKIIFFYGQVYKKG